MKKILVILGTRPEAIKLAPVILELKTVQDVEVVVCNTEQQKELSNQTLSYFKIKADINIDSMIPNQTLSALQSRLISKLDEVFTNENFDAAIVQGDTMSVFCGALVAFYHKVPVFHVEAGLRSFNLFEPFPEEAIRQMVSKITSLHFCPTHRSKKYLMSENIPEDSIIVTGNTVIDALKCLSEETLQVAESALMKQNISFDKKIVLVTVHRRENHGERLESIINGVLRLTKIYKDHQFVIPVHPNPQVKNRVVATFNNVPNVILTQPLDYPELVSLMRKSKLILTDSGGIQEEAPTFGIPILVLRYKTERMEGVEAGCAKLIGADADKIVYSASRILNEDFHSKTQVNVNPYGDGRSSERIVIAIKKFLSA